MKKEKAFFGCESSGHFYYKNNFFADSGVITSLIVLEIFSQEKKKGKKFSQLFEEYKKYAAIKEKSFIIQDKKNAYKKILRHFKKNAESIEEIDGISFDCGNYWFNIRFSQTEPVLRLNLEAVNEEILKKESRPIEKFLEKL